MLTLFGIKNCDTVKKACQWLDSHQVTYHFHDLRKDGLTTEVIQAWLTQVSIEQLLNKKSTTWRALSDELKNLSALDDLIQLLVSHPTLVKRPVVSGQDQVIVGFQADIYQQSFL